MLAGRMRLSVDERIDSGVALTSRRAALSINDGQCSNSNCEHHENESDELSGAPKGMVHNLEADLFDISRERPALGHYHFVQFL